MRPIAPHPVKETVRSLLDSRERSAATTTGSASRNVRPSPNAKTSASAKQQPGGCIDLTDDDDKGSSTKQATNMRTVVQTSQILTPVVQANALRSGILLPGSPVVLQPVTQGVRLGQGNVVYASGTSIVRPGVTVAGQVPQLRPGQILLQQQRSASNAVAVNRPPPPLKSAPGVQVIYLFRLRGDTLGPAYNEFSYNEHPIIASRFLYIKLIDCNVKKFGYNEQLVSSAYLFTRCKRDPV